MPEVFGAVSSTRRSWQELREVGGAHCFRTAAYDTKLNAFCIFVRVFMQYRPGGDNLCIFSTLYKKLVQVYKIHTYMYLNAKHGVYY